MNRKRPSRKRPLEKATPSSSSCTESEADPYSDDGEYGSDEEYVPDSCEEISSDEQTSSREKKKMREMSESSNSSDSDDVMNLPAACDIFVHPKMIPVDISLKPGPPAPPPAQPAVRAGSATPPLEASSASPPAQPAVRAGSATPPLEASSASPPVQPAVRAGSATPPLEASSASPPAQPAARAGSATPPLEASSASPPAQPAVKAGSAKPPLEASSASPPAQPAVRAGSAKPPLEASSASPPAQPAVRAGSATPPLEASSASPPTQPAVRAGSTTPPLEVSPASPPTQPEAVTSRATTTASAQPPTQSEAIPSTSTGRLSLTTPQDDNDWSQTTTPIPVFDFDFLSEGFRAQIGDDPTELDLFKCCFSNDLLEYLISCTNSYGQTLTKAGRPHKKCSRKQTFRDVDMDEMMKFLGMCLLHGQLSVPKMRTLFAYSNPLYFHPFFSFMMSQRRFEQILRALYAGDIDAKGEKKVTPFIDALTENYRKIFGPQKELSIDESLILFRGRLHFRQYIKSKKARYGIKFFELTTADGYVLNIIMYSGKSDETESTKKTERIVLKLLQPYLMKGHHVFMDNFYNDVDLSEKLLRLRTHTCGTLRQNRRTNPKVVTTAKLKKGDYCWRRKGNVYVSAWKDKRPVLAITTRNHPNMKPVANRFGKIFVKPEEIAEYNEYMGGIDRKDQMVSYYSSPKKTIRWYKKVIFHMLDITIWNAFYLHKKYIKGTDNYHFIDYRDSLIKQLTKINNALTGRDLIREGSIYANRRMDSQNFAIPVEPGSSRQISEGHWPEDIPSGVNSKRKFKYLNCTLCYKKKMRKETRYRCKGCIKKPALCPVCFEEWHLLNDVERAEE